MLDDVKSWNGKKDLLLKITNNYESIEMLNANTFITYVDKVKVMNNVSGSVPVPKSKGPFW
jgi:hypothetical protein